MPSPAGVLGPQSPMAQNAIAQQAQSAGGPMMGNLSPMVGIEELLVALRSGNISADMLLQLIAQLTGGAPQLPAGGEAAPVEQAFFG